ncbi:MAG: radical SAM protein [Eubacteriaceae bacterium]
MFNYKPSKYNLYHQKGTSLRVMGQLTRAVVEFDNCNLESFTNLLETLPQDEIEILENYQIIVKNGINEYEKYLQSFYENRLLENELSLTIGFTFKCNFDCLYCIQKENYKNREDLSIEDVDQIIDWIECFLSKENKIEIININYFGGEPTLNLQSVYYFSKRIHVICKKYGLDLYQQMVTNGFALNEDNINKLVELNITEFQITLDGLAKQHNMRRSRTFDSFSKIVDNIVYLAKKNAQIYLLHVFDLSNSQSAIELVDYFDGLSQVHKEIKSSICFNFVPTIPKRVESVSCNKYVDGNERLLSGKSVKAFVHAKEKGFEITNYFDVGHCFRQAKNTMLISPELELYKCYGVFGMKKYSICNLKSTTLNKFFDQAESMSTANGFSDQCKECDIVPLCRGGCQFSASESNNGIYGVELCERDLVLNSIQGFLENDLF